MAKQKRIATCDCETDPFFYGRVPHPFAWGFYDGETYIDFWGKDSTTDFIEYLKDEEDLIVYAHNGGKFDFFYLLPYLDPDVSIINGRIAKATLFGGRVEIRDSYLIYPLSLKSDDKLDIDYTKMEKEVRELHKQEIRRYLQQDCFSLYDVVTGFRNEYGGGLTLAGAAFRQLKLTGYPASPTHDSFDSMLRPFYMGGRVQCFETGAFYGDHIYVDIHSAYPYAMTFNHWNGSTYRETLRIPDIENGSWFARIDAVSRGALPFKQDNQTFYPDDNKKREYYASGWEIIAGLETGTLDIKKVHRVYRPTFSANFAEYVAKFFALKDKADIERAKCVEGTPEWYHWNRLRTFAKLMLNSCYGKFGQDGRKFESFKLCEYGDIPDDLHDWKPYAEAEGLISIYNRPDPVNRFYNVATAASITGFVRAYLWKNICASDGVLYSDTDSIICKKFGGSISDKLGDWGIEANLTEAYIAQKKMYACLTNKTGKDGKLITKVASKGVKLSFDQIKHGVLTCENIVHAKESPAFSLKFGARFTEREINFKNIAQNSCNNPEEVLSFPVSRRKNAVTITKPLKSVIQY
jgi:hypothetical protein